MGIVDYSDSDDDQPVKKIKTDFAPDVTVKELPTMYTTVDSKELTRNIPLKDLNEPIQGPANPFSVTKQIQARNMMSGFVEEHHMNDATFNNLSRTFDAYGYTVNPDGSHTDMVGDMDLAKKQEGRTIDEIKKKRKEREGKGNVEDDSFKGPWAGFKDKIYDMPMRTKEQDVYVAPQYTFDKKKLEPKETKETTTFHGNEEYDYLGRSFMHPPSDVGVNLHGEIGNKECFIPKNLIHTWTGHTKGVNAIRFFPKTAHLLLSCSLDHKIKLWDVYRERQCKRTYMGHEKGVRDVQFNNDGTKFLSASYDKFVKLWDTETGQCVQRYPMKKIPFCLRFNPNESKNNMFLVGSEDRKIYQYDTRSQEVVETYDRHLGPVNSITFCHDNRKFISTSDDKTLRIWEFGIPIVIKFVAESDLHSMPAVTLSYDRKNFACQSLDNKIYIFSAEGMLRQNKKKIFQGHLVAGYACQPGWSPDNRFIMSGDSEGKMWFWDYKTTKLYKKFQAHDKVITSCLWHPHESSKVATSSWDGTIK
ncbi:pre-mRNA-processing factor 17 [Boothiomyces macroporosus]|uniref:Pre-mRNA-processing factor 17 n=1 Tax=Boothiomyces macroporosus TaxID=261099 RepID=A0AAD5UGS1_9FUNG|nr:pre-mRNA-processing factor 17 [Boothiomyces macroporosus]